MKSAHQKNNSATAVNRSPFMQKGNGNYFFGKKSSPFFNKPAIQTKLTVNKPNDIYEQEADAMADKVVQRFSEYSFANAENNSTPFFNKPNSYVQRKCAGCEQEEKLQKKEEGGEGELLKNKLQKKPIFETNPQPPDDSLSFVQRTPFGGEGRGEVLQRKCAECEEEEKLQTKTETTSSQTASSSVVGNLNSSKSSGNPLPHDTRTKMESSFGADISHVRIHNDNAAVQMSKDLHAQAFTHGSDIYFNSGKYDANNKEGQHLLAHELTHVVQQNGESNIQKQPEQTTDSVDATEGQGQFLVEDSATPSEIQMRKSDFLQRLNSEVCQTVDEALQSTGLSSDNCPYIREVFARYQNSTPAEMEQVLQRYEPSTRFAQSADDLIEIIKVHVFAAAIQWAKTGELFGIPESIAGLISSGISSVTSVVNNVTNAISSVASSVSSAVSSIGDLFFKAKPGGSKATQSPLAVMQSLGKGSPMNSSTRGRMESAFGTNFSDVQIHTDSKAAHLSNNMNARAFTVGKHIAFGSGEHKPGTLMGDALMAHELAHVEQQKENSSAIFPKIKNSSADNRFENDADNSTYDFLMNETLQGGQKKSIKPKMKSGLSIHSCKSDSGGTPCSVTEAQTITTAKQTASGWVTTALGKLRTSPVPADVLAALQKNFGATDGVAANLPAIITKITTANTEMTTVPIACAGTEDSTCSNAPCGYTPGAGAHRYVICRNATLQPASDPIYQAGCTLHEAFHSAFSDFSGDSYSGWGGHSGSTPGYPGANPLTNADSYASMVIDLR